MCLSSTKYLYLSVHTVRGARPKISKRHATFRFKMETPPGENITAAEFRIYKEQVYSGEAKTENKTYLIKLYQVCNVLNVCLTATPD